MTGDTDRCDRVSGIQFPIWGWAWFHTVLITLVPQHARAPTSIAPAWRVSVAVLYCVLTHAELQYPVRLRAEMRLSHGDLLSSCFGIVLDVFGGAGGA